MKFSGRDKAKALAVVLELEAFISTLHPEHVPLVRSTREAIEQGWDVLECVGKTMRRRLQPIADLYPPFDSLFHDVSAKVLAESESSSASSRRDRDRERERERDRDRDRDGDRSYYRRSSNQDDSRKRASSAEPHDDHPPRNDTLICFHCGKPGHVKRRCRVYVQELEAQASEYKKMVLNDSEKPVTMKTPQ